VWTSARVKDAIDQPPPLDFAQLWAGEQRTLAERAARVPSDGVIVEIGTAQGGSASIFHEAAGRRGVQIVSFDIAPSPEAYERLKGTTVEVVAKPSVDGARAWKDIVGKPIDLLFIDGSHALQHVVEDFNAWLPFVKLGGEVIFHDYDSVERGGMVHLGTYVAVKTIVRQRLLDDAVHTDRLLCGTVNRRPRTLVTAADCGRTFHELARGIVTARDAKYGGWTLIGEDPLAGLLGTCLDMAGAAFAPPAAAAASGRFLLFSRPLAPALDILAARGIGDDRLVVVDSLRLCYFVAHALRHRRDLVVDFASSRSEVFRWEEVLSMFEHAFGPGEFPDAVPQTAGTDLTSLSRIVAREQVHLTILARLLEALLGTKP
jgi:predicted O-methyltransferase YrrM